MGKTKTYWFVEPHNEQTSKALWLSGFLYEGLGAQTLVCSDGEEHTLHPCERRIIEFMKKSRNNQHLDFTVYRQRGIAQPDQFDFENLYSRARSRKVILARQRLAELRRSGEIRRKENEAAQK